MYEKNVLYKFQLRTEIYYTGKVIEEDNIFIKVLSVRDEELMLNKNDIVRVQTIKN